MALGSIEDTPFLVCRSLQGQVYDLLQEDYRPSIRWVWESYHDRGREAVVEHELQNRKLPMAAFTRYLLHVWHPADSRHQLHDINYKLDLFLTREPSKRGNQQCRKKVHVRYKRVSDECERYKRVSDDWERYKGVSDECVPHRGVSNACERYIKNSGKDKGSALPSKPTTISGAGRARRAQRSAHTRKGAVTGSAAETSSPSSPSQGRAGRAARQVRQQRAAHQLLSFLSSVAGDTPHRSGGAQR